MDRKHTPATSIDIRGEFTNVRPVILARMLTHSRINVHFVAYRTSVRHLLCNSEGKDNRRSGVSVPQGGVLSPVLFNIDMWVLCCHIIVNTL